jgi:hypothetical protein
MLYIYILFGIFQVGYYGLMMMVGGKATAVSEWRCLPVANKAALAHYPGWNTENYDASSWPAAAVRNHVIRKVEYCVLLSRYLSPSFPCLPPPSTPSCPVLPRPFPAFPPSTPILSYQHLCVIDREWPSQDVWGWCVVLGCWRCSGLYLQAPAEEWVEIRDKR